MSGNENRIFYPAPSSETYQTGKVTLLVDEDIIGLDRLTNSDEFDLQFNFFSQSGIWWQIIIEPGPSNGLYPNQFQLWQVNVQTQNYKAEMFSIADWAQNLYKKGTIASLSWFAKNFILNSAFLEIRNPEGISDKWQLDFPEDVDLPPELEINSITDRTQPGACMSVFSITGSDGGSFFTASSGKGRIIYDGLVPDPTGALGAQTAESSNFKYSAPVLFDVQLKAYMQTFSL